MYDRYWRLRVAGALACIAAAAGFAAWYVAYVLPIDLRAGKLAFTGILAAVDVVFVLLGIAVYHLFKAAQERRRSRLRQEAMHGNQDAIPLARPLANRTANQSGSDEPLEVTFATAFQQWCAVIIRMVFAFGVAVLGITAVVQNVNVRRLGDVLICPAGHEPICAQYLAALMLLSLLFAVPCSLLCISVLIDTLRSLSITPLRLTVQTEGIVRQALVGKLALIPWSEIRLLEVWHSASVVMGRRVLYRHSLCYTSRHQFGWSHPDEAPPTSPLVGLGAAVTANSQLMPRTFDPVLVASTLTNPPPTLALGNRAGGQFLIILVLVASLLANVSFQPMVTQRDQTIWTTSLTVGLVVLLMFVLLSLRGPRLSASEQGGLALVSAASFDDTTLVIHPAATYEMTVGTKVVFKANQVIVAFLGILIALASGLGIVSEFDQALLNSNGTPLIPMSLASNSILIGLIAFGLVAVIMAVRARDTILLAEINGVRKRWLIGSVYIPWERVERIERKRYWGAPGYRIVSSAPSRVIQWPIQPFQPSRKPQEPSAILTTPDQMAQIVAQRSGRPIREVRR